ncbi:MAG: hypothetical protein ACRENE_27615 [Polyangiaceae bacterium]
MLAVALALGSSGCHRKHVPVVEVPELGYPACRVDGGVATSADGGAATVVASGHLRSGPSSQEQSVSERFELDRTPCGYVLHVRQEWPLDISDVEVHFDADLKPLWVWKRMTLEATSRPDGNADIRRYDLRTGEVFIKRRDPNGEIHREHLLAGGRMKVPQGDPLEAVIGPGRGIITAWLKRAKLPVGAKVKQLVLDFRSMYENLEMATLERRPDQFEPAYGKNVRVYTFFGRETVFADEDDVVIGDLAGMRPSALLDTPEPPPLPSFGGPDPVGTP